MAGAVLARAVAGAALESAVAEEHGRALAEGRDRALAGAIVRPHSPRPIDRTWAAAVLVVVQISAVVRVNCRRTGRASAAAAGRPLAAAASVAGRTLAAGQMSATGRANCRRTGRASAAEADRVSRIDLLSYQPIGPADCLPHVQMLAGDPGSAGRAPGPFPRWVAQRLAPGSPIASAIDRPPPCRGLAIARRAQAGSMACARRRSGAMISTND